MLNQMHSLGGIIALVFMIWNPSSVSAGTLECPPGTNHVEETTAGDAVGEWCEKDGARQGPYILREEGTLSRSGEFKDGKMNGLWRRYSKTGKLIDEGTWADNLPDGVWTFFDSEGKVSNRMTFARGERVIKDQVKTVPNPWIWKRGQILGAGIFQDSGGQVGTAFLSFVPGYHRGELTEWVSALALGGLKSRDSVKPVVWVFSASAGMRLRLSGFERFRLEPRIGVHSWLGSATAASFHIDTGYDFLPGRAAVVAGVEQVSFKVNGTTLLKVGVEYRFQD